MMKLYFFSCKINTINILMIRMIIVLFLNSIYSIVI